MMKKTILILAMFIVLSISSFGAISFNTGSVGFSCGVCSDTFYPFNTNPYGYINQSNLTGYVPYTGATTNVDLGANDFSVNGFSFKSDAIDLLGLEMVKNPNFVNDSEWTFGGDWYWNGVDKAKISIASVASTLEQAVGIVSGEKYRLRFTISNFVVGGSGARFIPRVGGTNIVGYQSGDGDYEYEFTAPNSGNLQLFAGAGSEFEVSNFSLKSLELETTVGNLRIKNNFITSLITSNTMEDLTLKPSSSTKNVFFSITSQGVANDGAVTFGRLVDDGTKHGIHFSHILARHIRIMPKTSNVATVDLTLLGQKAFSSATGSNANGGNLVLQGGVPSGVGLYGDIVFNSLGGNVKLNKDNSKLFFGADDASITYDGTNMVINPKEVGAGILDVLGVLQTDGYNSADGSNGWTGTCINTSFKNGLAVSCND